MKITVEYCSKCEESHEIEAKKLDTFVEANGKVWTHWFICPNTKDLVLVRQEHIVSKEKLREWIEKQEKETITT